MSAATETQLEEIEGRVTKVHGRASAKWSAGRMLVGTRTVSYTATGLTTEGMLLTLRGTWESDPKWGQQFCGDVIPAMPKTAHGFREWLKRNAYGVGTAKAQALVGEYGTTLFDVCESDPEQVAQFASLPVEVVRGVAQQWNTQRNEIAAFALLTEMGLTANQAEKLYAKYRGSAADVARTDPYRIVREVDGFGWKTVDEIARLAGVPANSPKRYQAAVLQAVRDAFADGSTCITESAAVGRACDLCELPLTNFLAAFEPLVGELVAANQLVRVPTHGDFVLALPQCHNWERIAWAAMERSREPNPFVKPEAAAELAARYATVNGKELDDTQRAALLTVASNRLTFITGGAGSGKTLTASAIYKMFTELGVDVRLCAPTGKAARRLQEVIGAPAETIHRLLGYSPGEEGSSHAGFTYHLGFKLPRCVVLVDEVSMVPADLAYFLLGACGCHTAVVLIGDPNQLPPVGAGALLRDALALDLAPVARLGRCHRQAGTLKKNCNAILTGEFADSVKGEPGAPWIVHRGLKDADEILKAVSRLWREHFAAWGFDPSKDVQFLTAKHDGPLGTKFLNRYLQYLRQHDLGTELPEPKFGDDGRARLMVGDKVIQTKNDYDLNVMNGTQGVVTALEPLLEVEYADRAVEYPRDKASSVELAYVITPHRGQGSEWPCVAVVVPKAHAFMQHRHWLYTACTRARKTCVVFGDAEGVRRAVQKVELDKRTTLLGAFAACEAARPNTGDYQ